MKTKFLEFELPEKYETIGENCLRVKQEDFNGSLKQINGIFIGIKLRPLVGPHHPYIEPLIIFNKKDCLYILSITIEPGVYYIYNKADYLNIDCDNNLTKAFEQLGISSFFKSKNHCYNEAHNLFMAAIKTEELNDIIARKKLNIKTYWSFAGNFYLGEIYNKGCLVSFPGDYIEKNGLIASSFYGDACWVSIQGFEPESDEMAVACYCNGMERLKGVKQLYGDDETKEHPYKRNTVEALSMLELAKDWNFGKRKILEKLGYSKSDMEAAYEECKILIKEKYKNAKYITVYAGKNIIALGENENKVMNFSDDKEANAFVDENKDLTNGFAERSVKFVLNTQTWETLYGNADTAE